MKNYRETVIEKVQNFLDQNVGDYSYFRAATGYEAIKKHFEYMEGEIEQYKGIGEYLEKIEEESHIESELG